MLTQISPRAGHGAPACPAFSESGVSVPDPLTALRQPNYQLTKAVLMNYVSALRKGSGQMSVSVKRGRAGAGARGPRLCPLGHRGRVMRSVHTPEMHPRSGLREVQTDVNMPLGRAGSPRALGFADTEILPKVA